MLVGRNHLRSKEYDLKVKKCLLGLSQRCADQVADLAELMLGGVVAASLGGAGDCACFYLIGFASSRCVGRALTVGLRLMSINASSVPMTLLFGTAGAVVEVSVVFWTVGLAVGAGARFAWLLRPELTDSRV